jgi:hypothetical protein
MEYEQLTIPGLEVPPPPPAARAAAQLPWPSESERQIDAVLAARMLLARLIDPELTPRVPRAIRSEARALLRWFPQAEQLRPVLAGPAFLGAAPSPRPLLPFDPAAGRFVDRESYPGSITSYRRAHRAN